VHLNRLLNTSQHTFGAASGSFMGNWTQSNTNTTDNYAETFRYDANGNILQLNRLLKTWQQVFGAA
jgi:hypothetical protein